MTDPERGDEPSQMVPTRASKWVTVVVTVGLLAVLLREFPVLSEPIAIGAGGAVVLATAVWASGTHRSPVARSVAGVFLMGGGVAIIGGVAVGALILIAQTFPVDDAAYLSVGSLIVAGHTGLVFGASLAVFGVALSLRNPATADAKQTTRVGVGVGSIPLVTVVVFLVGALGLGFNPERVVTPVASAGELLVAPSSPRLHLWSLLALGTVGVLSISLLFEYEEIKRVTPALGALAAVVFVVELTVSPLAIQSRLGATSDPIQTATTVPALRIGLLILAFPAFVMAFDWVVRRVSTVKWETTGAFAAGIALTLGVFAGAKRAYNWLVTELVRLVPEEIEGDVAETATESGATVGESTLILGAMLVCLAVAMALVSASDRARRGGAFATDVIGPPIASLGLFIAVLSAAVLEAPAWVVIGGIGATLLVWETGRFGGQLADEIGTGRVSRVVGVHLAGAALVGLLGVAVAMVAVGQFPTEPDGTPTAMLALSSVVIGLCSLVVALR